MPDNKDAQDAPAQAAQAPAPAPAKAPQAPAKAPQEGAQAPAESNVMAQLRADLTAAQDELKGFRDAAKAQEDAGKTEAQRLADELKGARKELAEAKARGLVADALRTHKLPETAAKLFAGLTEAADIASRAEDVAALFTPPADSVVSDAPEVQLTPGHKSSGSGAIDHAAIARAALSARG